MRPYLWNPHTVYRKTGTHTHTHTAIACFWRKVFQWWECRKAVSCHTWTHRIVSLFCARLWGHWNGPNCLAVFPAALSFTVECYDPAMIRYFTVVSIGNAKRRSASSSCKQTHRGPTPDLVALNINFFENHCGCLKKKMIMCTSCEVLAQRATLHLGPSCGKGSEIR